ncbi:MAG: amino acid adenylation domain-containing protein, partial [bacterium]|nr:amino acid adenylation domain-containing protein [bacterium]
MLVKKFEAQVEKSPGSIAVKAGEDVRTYSELNRYANGIASLISAAAGTGETVGLLFEHGVHMIAAILGALKAGKVYVPLSIDYPENRLSYMLTNSQSSLIITNAPHLPAARKLSGEINIPVLDISAAESAGPEKNPLRDPDDDRNAYILYTSGSTGRPKGVVQTHRNAEYYVRNWIRVFSITPEDRMTLFSSFCHDGSVQDMFSALHTGAALFPFNMKNRESTVQLSDFLRDETITIWHSVPSLYSFFVNSFSGVERFPALRSILLGGEAVREHDVKMFQQYFPGAIFANVYGQTESSVSSICLIRAQDTFRKVMLGDPLDETEIYVVDDEGEPVDPLETGEILVSCPHISPGYWKNPEASRQVFRHDEDGSIYWTGDLGRLLPNGGIEFMGRRDHQVKIRGFRVELGEIETQLLTHEDVKEAVVTARKDQTGDTYLCAYIVRGNESAGEADISLWRQFLAADLPDYMIPTYFTVLDQMPLTQSGKIDRKALPEPEAPETTGDYTPPRDETEHRLAEIWSVVLGIETGSIGIDMDFFQLGGHSLKATIMASKLHKAFNVRVPLAAVFRTPTIRGLAPLIEGASEERHVALEKAPEKEYYQLSPAQRRLYVLQQLDDGGTSYNLPAVMVLEGNLDVEKFEETFKEMISRHESLRTSFHMIDGEPFQKIHKAVDFKIKYKEKNDSSRPHPFDLSHAPLIRVELTPVREQKYILMLDMHHIISDGTSMELFVREFMALYAASELSPLRFQYKDYSEWRNSPLWQEVVKQQETYWLKTFEGEIPVLNLPYDFARPAVQSSEGRTLEFEIPDIETLKALARSNNVTLYMFLLSLLNLWLSKLSRQEDIVIGTPIAGRRHADLQGVMGVFINTLALRNRPEGGKTFTQFLQEVRANTLEAFENQDYQFEELVEKVSVRRDTSRNPLFDIMFILQNFDIQPGEIPEVEIEGLKLKPYPFERNTSRFDLTLTTYEKTDRLLVKLEYCTRLFKEETIRRFFGYFKTIVTALTGNPEMKLSEVDIISGDERRQIMDVFNDTSLDYPKDKTLHRLFEDQVQRTPDIFAVTTGYPGHKTGMTYNQLNQKANQLARRLIEKGVGPGHLVGLLVSRRIEMLVALLGILKAGAAYLPLDPDYPDGRIHYILQHSKPRILLTEAPLEEKIQRLTYTGETLDLLAPDTYSADKENPENRAAPEDLAYVIYTSGSTGNPKGVMIRHRNVTNFIEGMAECIGFAPGNRFLALTTLSFDIFVLEVFIPLTRGMQVVLANEQQQIDPGLLAEVIIGGEIDILQLTPSRLKLLFNSGHAAQCLTGVGALLVGGEAFPAHLLQELKQVYPGRLYNVYGPTETTVWSTVKELTRAAGVTIGTPIANTQVYIMDRYHRLQPPGIAGELWIGGDGVAPGYFKNPELTSEKFIDNCYKTGDLARWLPHGELEFLGRIDHQLKIRGFRIEPEEIEEQLLAYPRIKEVVVVDKKDRDGETYLCTYFVTEDGETVEAAALRDHLSRSLPSYMIPAFFIYLEKVPVTPNGKIDRRALPDPDMTIGKEVVLPRNSTEEKLVGIWSRVLGIEGGKIGIDADYFYLGGHSLNATRMIAEAAREFDVKLPLAVVFKRPSIRGLAEYIREEAVEETYINLEKAPEKEYYDLSPAQRRLYVLQQLDAGGTSYNLPAVMELEGNLDVEKLEEAFKEMIRRHESLRTSFIMVNEEPVQRIHENVEFKIDDIIGSPRRGVGTEHRSVPFDLQ